MENLINEFSTGLFIWQVVVFIALIFLLKKFAWGPILTAVKDREDSIVSALKSAEKARTEMQALQSDNDKILRQAREERENILKEGRTIRDNMVNEAKDAASAEADKIVASAKAQIENDKNKAIHELKNQVADLSLSIAEKILRSELSDTGKQKELVEAAINEANFN